MGLEVEFAYFGWLFVDYLKGNQDSINFILTHIVELVNVIYNFLQAARKIMQRIIY